MALSQRLEIRQSHALVMTPQLMQAIKLLELSNMDLTAYVEGELERNPLLEQVGDGEAAVAAPAMHGPVLAGDSVEGGGGVVDREILDGQERVRCQVHLDVPGRGRVLEGEAVLVLPASDDR